MSDFQEPSKYLRYFIATVLILAAISIFYKVVVLFNSGSFKQPTYNLLMLGEDARIVHLDTERKKIVSYEIEAGRSKLLNKSIAVQSATVGVLIDGVLVFSPTEKNGDLSDFATLISFLTVKVADRVNINEYDIFKFYLSARLIGEGDKKNESIRVSDLPLVDVLDTFSDSTILEENATVGVVNSTQVDGFGSDIARALENVGYNVVDVETSEGKNSTVITNEEYKVTSRRLVKSLKIKSSAKKSSGLADITVIFGKDALHK